MVRIKNITLGIPEGKIGNVVYRTINGKTFASQRPEKYNASQSKAAKTNRGRFGIAIQFAKYVNSIPELSKIWKYVKIKGATSFNKIVKYNIKSINNGSLTIYNIITPNLSANFIDINNISFNNESVNLKIDLYCNINIPETNSTILIYALLAFQNPKPKNRVPISLAHISYEITSSEIGKSSDAGKDAIELDLTLTGSQKNLAPKYKSCIIYLAGIIDSPFPKKVIYSSTYAKSISLT